MCTSTSLSLTKLVTHTKLSTAFRHKSSIRENHKSVLRLDHPLSTQGELVTITATRAKCVSNHNDMTTLCARCCDRGIITVSSRRTSVDHPMSRPSPFQHRLIWTILFQSLRYLMEQRSFRIPRSCGPRITRRISSPDSVRRPTYTPSSTACA